MTCWQMGSFAAVSLTRKAPLCCLIMGLLYRVRWGEWVRGWTLPQVSQSRPCGPAPSGWGHRLGSLARSSFPPHGSCSATGQRSCKRGTYPQPSRTRRNRTCPSQQVEQRRSVGSCALLCSLNYTGTNQTNAEHDGRFPDCTRFVPIDWKMWEGSRCH